MNTTQDIIWLECEAFDERGGWEIDAQFMDQMGSPFLLAHGFGTPVADARTTFSVKKTARHRIWVRSRKWCVAADVGCFQVIVNGHPVEQTFGNAEEYWHWQDGGCVDLSAGKNEICLRDLDGFDGRCDCVVLSPVLDWWPPTDPKIFAQTRRSLLGLKECEAERHFDLVVIGGGISGMCAAIGAARKGLEVALIQDRECWGGNASKEIRVGPASDRNLAPYERIGDLVAELEGSVEGVNSGDGSNADTTASWPLIEEQRRAIISAEKSLHVLQPWRLNNVDTIDGTIQSVVVEHIKSAERQRLHAPLWVDATGDGCLGYLAGAEHRYGREARAEYNEAFAPEESDDQVLGATLHWYSEQGEEEFPVHAWGLEIDNESCQHRTQGAWNWEAGFFDNMVDEAESIRDLLLHSIYANWSWQKHHSERKDEYANKRLAWVGHVLGKRESRRLIGDIVYSQADIDAESGKYDDECVGCRWGIDVHVPNPDMKDALYKNTYRSVSQHPQKDVHPTRYLPYRSLYSKNVNNLFVAGRCASMTHLAHAYFRCMRTCGLMGEVVALAAAVAHEHKCTPRAVYQEHWLDLKESLCNGLQQLCRS